MHPLVARSAVEGEALILEWTRHPARPERCALVPSAEGARLFRRCGRLGLLEGLARWATAHDLDPGRIAIVDELPTDEVGYSMSRTEPRLLALEWQGAERIELQLLVPFDLAVFNGHFPEVPIVPGAMLAGWAASLAAREGRWRHGVRRVQAMKFRRIVQPGPVYRLRLAWTTDGGRLDFRYESPVAMHAAGCLLAPAT